MNTPLLIAQGLKKTFKQPKRVEILKGVDLTVHAGESVAIIGKSGQGKSTLLQILGTLETPCAGSLEIAQMAVRASTKNLLRSQHLAFIFQSFHLLEDYTALENVLMPAKIARQPVGNGSKAYKKGIELLEYVGLGERIHYHTKLLSGGEKQRVAIARALCNDPSLLFADEPSGNLDQENSSFVHQLLLNFAKQPGKALVVVTHDPRFASLCSTCYRLEEGILLKNSLSF